MSERIYLDHAATTPLGAAARAAMEPWHGARFGNPSSLHAEGREAAAALETARDDIRGALGAVDFDLVFTGGGTEAITAAVLGPVLARLGAGANPADLHLVATAVEHAAVLGAVEGAGRLGLDATVVPVDSSGRVEPARILDSIRPETVLASVMTVNNEIGTLQPIAEIGEALRELRVPLHTDAIQALGKLPIDLATWPVDLVTLSAHKIGGPKGVGALLVRRGLAIEAVVRGGEQEHGLRAGTQNVPAAVGFAAALTLAVEEVEHRAARMVSLRDRLLDRVRAALPDAIVATPTAHAAPHVLNFSVPGVRGESLLARLDAAGVAISTGSACNAGSGRPSHVLTAIGADARRARETVRVSVAASNTPEEVDRAVDRLAAAVRELRALAP